MSYIGQFSTDISDMRRTYDIYDPEYLEQADDIVVELSLLHEQLIEYATPKYTYIAEHVLKKSDKLIHTLYTLIETIPDMIDEIPVLDEMQQTYQLEAIDDALIEAQKVVRSLDAFRYRRVRLWYIGGLTQHAEYWNNLLHKSLLQDVDNWGGMSADEKQELAENMVSNTKNYITSAVKSYEKFYTEMSNELQDRWDTIMDNFDNALNIFYQLYKTLLVGNLEAGITYLDEAFELALEMKPKNYPEVFS